MRLRPAIMVILLTICDAYKFLMYSPIFGFSHTKFMGAIADALTEAGHNVTILMAVLDRDQEKLIEPTLTKQIFKVEPDPRTTVIIKHKGNRMSKMWTMQPTPFQLLQNVSPNLTAQFAYQCEKVFSDDDLMDKLKAMKFDAGIAETFTICGFGELAVTGDQMSIFGRLINTMDVMISSKYFENIYQKEISAFRSKFGQTFEGHDELLAKVSYVLTNSIPYVDFPRPLLHKTVQIGGIAVALDSTKQSLEKKWEEVLEERNTTVLISFGTVTKSLYMPDRYRKGILEVIRSMPETTFLWKYEDSEAEFARDFPNLHLSTWLPQHALINNYAQNAKRLSEMLLNLPISPKDLVVKHCEFAARFGRLPNLDPYGRQLSFVQYFLIDIFLAVAAVFILALIAFIWLLRKCSHLFVKNKMD